MTDDRETEVWGNKDGREWRIGGEDDVAWIRENTEVSFAITSAIPPVFEAYATLQLPSSGDHLSASPLEDTDRYEAGVLAVLSEHSAVRQWWIGYLDTGGADTVFHDVRKVRPGPTDAWYVLVEAGPEQAGVWREREHWKSSMPTVFAVTWRLALDDAAEASGSRAPDRLARTIRSQGAPMPAARRRRILVLAGRARPPGRPRASVRAGRGVALVLGGRLSN